jgi:hypothetical protein
MGAVGITPPFLAGALRMQAAPQFQSDYIRSPFQEMRDRPVAEHVVQVSWCNDIDAPVLNTTKLSAMRMNAACAFDRPDGPGQSIVFSPNMQLYWNSKDPNELMQKLVDYTSPLLATNRCSRRWSSSKKAFEYGEMTEGEILFIEDVLQLS